MLNRISHIGVLVNDIEAALRIWRDQLGFKKFSEARFEVEGIRSVFLSLSGRPGEMSIELMEPPLLPAGIGLRERRGLGRGRRPADVKRLSRSGGGLNGAIDQRPASPRFSGTWVIPTAPSAVPVRV